MTVIQKLQQNYTETPEIQLLSSRWRSHAANTDAVCAVHVERTADVYSGLQAAITGH